MVGEGGREDGAGVCGCGNVRGGPLVGKWRLAAERGGTGKIHLLSVGLAGS
jgi:hypothetical protein